MSLTESLTVAVLVLTGIGMPALGYMMSRQDKHREDHFVRIGVRLDHLDGCMDDLKTRVLGGTITRAELEAKMAQLRSEIHDDTSGLHDRVMRLEDQQLRRAGELR
jgi:hypothetical protein